MLFDYWLSDGRSFQEPSIRLEASNWLTSTMSQVNGMTNDRLLETTNIGVHSGGGVDCVDGYGQQRYASTQPIDTVIANYSAAFVGIGWVIRTFPQEVDEAIEIQFSPQSQPTQRVRISAAEESIGQNSQTQYIIEYIYTEPTPRCCAFCFRYE